MIPDDDHVHRRRSIRDGNGREVGYCCLRCGDLLAAARLPRDELWLLEACSLTLLAAEKRGDVELDRRARQVLQARRRKLTRLRNRGKLRRELRDDPQAAG